MQCATMNRRTLTMNWDGLGEDDDDDRFFESYERISSVVPLDLASSGSDDDGDFEDSRMSFVSAISSASIKSIHPLEPSAKYSSILAGYDMWMAEPGDIRERRKRLLQGMGLSSTKDMLRLASAKIVGAVSRKHDNGQVSTVEVDSSPTVKVDSSPKKESRGDEPSPPPPSHSHPTAIVLVRSRSDGDIDAFSVHAMAGTVSDRPPLAEIIPMPSERRRKGKNNRKKGNSIPDYVNVPETVFALSEKPVCTFKGHQDDVLDLSWSRSQGAIVGSHQGICRIYSIDDCKLEHRNDIQMKIKSQAKKLPGFQSQAQAKKITGFQFAPWNPSEVLITSTDSRIRIYNGSEIIQKYRGFRNTSSQISASFSPDGKHVISASEDSQVYIWKVDESKNPGAGKRRSRITVHAHEHFHCKDVSVAIPYPGSIKNEPPIVEIHSKRHSKRSTAPPPNSSSSSPTLEDNLVGISSRRHLPPLPKKNNGLERITSCADEDFAHSAHIDPGIGVSNSFGSSSASISYGDSPSISASATSPSQSWSTSWSLFDNGGQTVQATAWGLVIITASLEGEIRVYQNFGLPLKVSRQANLFRD